MIDLTVLLADLRDEGELLDSRVAGAEWRLPTPATGWTIAHQIAHLAWTDEQAILAATDPERFAAAAVKAFTEGDPSRVVDDAAAEVARRPDLLEHWRGTRAALADALANAPAGTRIPWFGPPMSPASMATARIMETWAHGTDVADALGIAREATLRLRHVAHIGVRTRDFAYVVRDLPVPTDPFRVELAGPSDEVWTWGPEDAEQRVSGPALDFCLLVTQRVHRDDTALTAEGAEADRWLGIAQAFAGPPGEGRARA
ncbi:TIGR03084 family metal-binding protein [Actinokineospora sp. UTMC 2448]|uniref:TIGR03084 family metal-binding protein n=1 Tax=Actinokineospora sp. UTMC 2448 TaxID=2268449 RepID=UPI002164259D|nr:TIGR03084 family metal-binding protein [Actinokineospora sp. UTMC 2448]UVS78078.1 putative Actinobacterial protein [Actinokineospora sp. UTMC 2448]